MKPSRESIDRAWLMVPKAFGLGWEPSPKYAKHPDRVRLWLHKITVKLATVEPDEKGRVPLNSKMLRDLCGNDRDFTSRRKDMIDDGLIDTDGSYRPGERSAGYRLGESLRGLKLEWVEVTDKTLRRNLLEARRLKELGMLDGASAATPSGGDSQPLGSLSAVNAHLERCLHEIRIDYQAANQLLDNGGDDFDPVVQASIMLIDAGDIHFFPDDPFGRRIHTNLTRLDRRMRRFLSVRGKTLVNLDIRNSQPLMLCLLLRQRFPESIPDDVRHYIALCEAGQFYDYLIPALGFDTKPAPRVGTDGSGRSKRKPRTKPVRLRKKRKRRATGDARSRFKRAFFAQVFFCKIEAEREIAQQFGGLFPNVMAFVHEAKATDYKNLCLLLQRAESDLMIRSVCSRVMIELPDAWVATIHDSIVTTPEHAKAIQAIIQQEFEKISLHPTVNPEHWN